MMKLSKSETCLNCGNNTQDSKYCSNCGQKNIDKHLSFSNLTKDFVGDYFTFDSKLFRSLLPLLFKPGFLTKEYILGRRMKYIKPFRLYFFTTFIFFAVVAMTTDFSNNDASNTKDNNGFSDSLMTIINKHHNSIPQNIEEDILKLIHLLF